MNVNNENIGLLHVKSVYIVCASLLLGFLLGGSVLYYALNPNIGSNSNVKGGAYDASSLPGTVWWNGTVAPSLGIGKIGDFYLNVANGNLYNKMNSTFGFNYWLLVGNLKGRDGLQGATGLTGAVGPRGAAGPIGPAGVPGIAGTNGTMWYSGIGVPSNSLGINGDYFLDTSQSDIYSKGSNGWTRILNIKGATGPQGPAGANGSTILTGRGEPNSTIGNDGDYYLNLNSSYLFKKTIGNWTPLGSIANGARSVFMSAFRDNKITWTAPADGIVHFIGTVWVSTYNYSRVDFSILDGAEIIDRTSIGNEPYYTVSAASQSYWSGTAQAFEYVEAGSSHTFYASAWASYFYDRAAVDQLSWSLSVVFYPL